MECPCSMGPQEGGESAEDPLWKDDPWGKKKDKEMYTELGVWGVITSPIKSVGTSPLHVLERSRSGFSCRQDPLWEQQESWHWQNQKDRKGLGITGRVSVLWL